MKKLIKMLAIIIVISSVNIIAQEKSDYSNEPGYVDFGDLSKFYNGDNVTEILVERNLLKLVANATKDEDTALYDLLNGLKLIKVNSFKNDGSSRDEIVNKIEDINNKLKAKNWDRIVYVKSGGEYTSVFIKSSSSDNLIEGLVVTTYQKDGEATFVNIVGKINLESIGRLGKKFDIPSLGSIGKGS
jgi:Domain of unknown function (DUF4252)